MCQSEGKWRGCATTWLETVSLVPYLFVACSAKVRREKALVKLVLPHPFNYKYLAHFTILVPFIAPLFSQLHNLCVENPTVIETVMC